MHLTRRQALKLSAIAGLAFIAAVLIVEHSLSRKPVVHRRVLSLIQVAGNPYVIPGLDRNASAQASENACVCLHELGETAETVICQELNAKKQWGNAIYSKLYFFSNPWLSQVGVRLPKPDPDARLRKQLALLAVGRMGSLSPKVEQAILASIADSELGYKLPALFLLGYERPESEQSLTVIRAAMEDKDLAKHLHASSLLSWRFRMPEPSLKSILRDLDSPFNSVRRSAVTALCRLGTNGLPGFSALLNLCSDTNPLVQLEAVQAIGDLGHAASNAIPTLAALAAKTNCLVRADIMRTIDRIR